MWSGAAAKLVHACPEATKLAAANLRDFPQRHQPAQELSRSGTRPRRLGAQQFHQIALRQLPHRREILLQPAPQRFQRGCESPQVTAFR